MFLDGRVVILAAQFNISPPQFRATLVETMSQKGVSYPIFLTFR